MTRCNSCFTKTSAKHSYCPVCGIVPNKKKADLSPAEKKVRYAARCILGVSVLHLIGLVLCFYILFVVNPAARAGGKLVFSPPIISTLAAFNLILAIGLSRYAFWAYKMATAYYFLLGIVNVISVQIPGILLVLILLYFVGNRTAKAIFERQGPQLELN